MKIFLHRILIYCEVSYLNNNLILKIFKRLSLVTSPFSDPTLLIIFAQFLISFLTVYNINTFETHSLTLWRPIPVCKIPKKRDQRVGLSGFWLLMLWALFMQSFMLLRLDAQFFHLSPGLLYKVFPF